MANSGEKFLYFLIGGFVGASVALLFAPKSGEETRQFLEGKYREGAEGVGRTLRSGREYIDHAREDLSGKITGGIEKGREAVNRQKDQLSQAIEAGKKAYQEEKANLNDQTEDS